MKTLLLVLLLTWAALAQSPSPTPKALIEEGRYRFFSPRPGTAWSWPNRWPPRPPSR